MLEFIIKRRDKGFHAQEYLSRTLDDKKDLIIENFLLYVDKAKITDESILLMFSCNNSYEPRMICYTYDDSVLNKNRKNHQMAEVMQFIDRVFGILYELDEEVAATKLDK